MLEPSRRESLLVSIDHVQLAIPVGAEPVARAYWVDLLGLIELQKPASLAARGGAWFASTDGRVQIHVGVEKSFGAAQKAHPALLISSLDALAAMLIAAGYAVRWDDEIPSIRRFHTDDPFGNRIEMIQASA